MKTKILAIALFGFTAAAVAFYPHKKAPPPVFSPPPVPAAQNPLSVSQHKVDVVFALDTTGSMGGLIRAAKEKIWSIASTLASAQSTPEIRMGLVAYRDRGDSYVTKVIDLSEDLDSMYAQLMDFRAAGGGDGPESVNQALYEAVHSMSWSQNQNAYKVVFLVGDAPPHMDYENDVKYPQTLRAAQRKGIVVNAIQAGQNGRTTTPWQQIAQLGAGKYFNVGLGGNAIAIATPYDDKLAKLSMKIERTRLYYGDENKKAQQKRKLAATAKVHAGASAPSRARRAAFNVSKAGATNFLGENELVEGVSSGRVKLEELDQAHLPEPMQAMAPAERRAVIERTARERSEFKRELEELSTKRARYLREKVATRADAKDSLDQKVFGAIVEQAADVGLSYDGDALKY